MAQCEKPHIGAHMVHWKVFAWRSAGAAAAVLAMYFLAGFGEMPLMLVPFATSIVLVFGLPEAEPSQPRALVGGHLISAAVGIAFAAATGPSPWAGAIAVGLAMAAMHYTRTFHPPAGIDPLIVVNEHLGWTFLFIPVATGAVLLACFAFLWHNVPAKRTWPARWW
jgi:CBS-domain-containing membrane protein